MSAMPDSRARPAEQIPKSPTPGRLPPQMLALLERHLPAVVWMTDANLRLSFSLGRGMAELGMHPPEVAGRTLYECFGVTDPEFPPIAAHRRALAGESQAFEWPWGERIFQVYLEPLREDSGSICGVLGVAVDMTEHDRAERARLASEQRYRSLFENAHDVVFVLDLAGNFLSVNRAAQRISGYRRHELLGMNISQLLDKAASRYVSELIHRALGGETSAQFELPLRARDGRLVYLDVSARLEFANGAPAAICGIARDVTERKRLEAQLWEAQKMELIGALAGSVAHDFNNLLTAILGYADLLRSQKQDEAQVLEAADVIQNAAERGRQLAARLLGLSRRGKAQDTAVDLHALLREISASLSRTLPPDITLLECFEAPRAVTRGDPGQLHQALLTLALNARDALAGSGTLMLRTELVSLKPETYRDLGVAGPGPHVKVSVTDTGAGIAPEHLPRLFEPYFTTKPETVGAGTGLAMVHGIVRNHGGTVRVASRPGQGSTFEVYLPLFETESHPEVSPPEGSGEASGAILVIDDDPMVARTAVRLLERLGYQAVYLTDARQALEVLRQDPGAFDLVLLDMVMPGMGGAQCLRELRSLCPRLPVLVTTGYAGEGAIGRMRAEGAAGFLAKPFTLDQLGSAVRSALEARRAGPIEGG